MGRTVELLVDTQMQTSLFNIEKTESTVDCPIHFHDFFKFELITQTNGGTTAVNGKQTALQKGYCCCLRLSDFHEIHPKEYYEAYDVRFMEELVPQKYKNTAADVFGRGVQLGEDDYAVMLNLLDTLNAIYNSTSSHAQELAAPIMEVILDLYYHNLSVEARSECSASSEAVNRAILYIRNHFKENIKLKDIAKMTYLNEDYLSTALKKVIGKNFKSYLTQLKMNHALKLLDVTDFPISVIAKECGYSSISNFSREFKAYFGYAPSQRRSQPKQEVPSADLAMMT